MVAKMESYDRPNMFSRKQMRKALRKQKKILRAINYAKQKNTVKVCISNEDVLKVRCLKSVDLTSNLKGKICCHKSDLERHRQKRNSKSVKKKKRDNTEGNKNLEEPSLSFSSNANLRLAKLQEYVNQEAGKMRLDSPQDEVKPIKNKQKSSMISDNVKLKDLKFGQREDEKEINSLARKLHLNAYQKKSLFPTFAEDFGMILDDIEKGKISDTRLYQDYEVVDSSDEEKKMEEEINLLIKDGGRTDIKYSKQKKRSKNDSLLDEEAEEVSNSEAEAEDSAAFVKDEDFAFEGGSTFTQDSGVLSSQPTINTIFDLYVSDSEDEEDTDLDGFVVSDDDIQYDSENSEIDVIEHRIERETKAKLKMIKTSKEISINESGHLKAKRRRISSDSSEVNASLNLQINKGKDDYSKPLSFREDVNDGRKKANRKKKKDGEEINSEGDERLTKFRQKTKSIPTENSSNNPQNDLSVVKKKKEKKKGKLKQENKTISQPTSDMSKNLKANDKGSGTCYEDIYGRLRDKEGNIIENGMTKKYIPPSVKKIRETEEHLVAMQRKLKGLLNRLTENNLAGIVSQVESQYQLMSRNDLNEALTKLIFEMIVLPVSTPERLVQEHALFIAILSANVGPEVGGHILSEFVIKFIEDLDTFVPTKSCREVDSKELDNTLLFIAQLYNFRVVDASLIYDILSRLYTKFEAKEIELILLILGSVGFCLRRDDPLALKRVISDIQSKADGASTGHRDTDTFTKVKFMLETLTAIRNNNISKVSKYDNTHSEHLKLLMKGIIRKGQKPSELKVSLEDIMKSRTEGKWWLIGSAWSRGLKETQPPLEEKTDSTMCPPGVGLNYSEAFKKKAQRYHLARPPRINILFALTEGAEDYVDSFEKLIQLNLPPSQESEIFSVILLCNEKYRFFNIFYVKVAVKLISYKKRLGRTLQYLLWDKFSDLNLLKTKELRNLAEFVGNMVAEDALHLSVLKRLDFSCADETMVSFLRQCLLVILLHPQGNYVIERTFSKLAQQQKLKVFRQGLRIFLLKFITPKRMEGNKMKELLARRVQLALDILTSSGGVKL